MKLEASRIDRPCDFPIKVFGQSHQGFARTLMEVVVRHDPNFQPGTINMENSTKSRHTSLTCIVHASSCEQLDALYQELCDHPMVVKVL